MYKKLVFCLLSVAMAVTAACNPIKKIDDTYQKGIQILAETCTPENSWSHSCDNLP